MIKVLTAIRTGSCRWSRCGFAPRREHWYGVVRSPSSRSNSRWFNGQKLKSSEYTDARLALDCLNVPSGELPRSKLAASSLAAPIRSSGEDQKSVSLRKRVAHCSSASAHLLTTAAGQLVILLLRVRRGVRACGRGTPDGARPGERESRPRRRGGENPSADRESSSSRTYRWRALVLTTETPNALPWF